MKQEMLQAPDVHDERPGWIHVVKWIVVVLFAARLLQLFVAWLTRAR